MTFSWFLDRIRPTHEDDDNTHNPHEIGKGLYRAAALGHEALVRELLNDPRVNPNYRPTYDKVYDDLYDDILFMDNCTALHMAASQGHLNIVKLLVAAGAHMNMVGPFGLRPLQQAMEHGHEHVALWLLQQGARPVNFPSGDSCLHVAVARGYTALVAQLVRHESTRDNTRGSALSSSPLHVAAQAGHVALIHILLDTLDTVNANSENVNSENANGNVKPGWKTTLSRAVRRHQSNIQPNSKPAIECPDHEGRTPLHYAVSCGQTDAIEALLDRGALVDSVDHLGRTPLCFAKKESVTQLLLDRHANLEARDLLGHSVLHGAVCLGNNDCDQVQLLLNRGARMNVRNENDFTPLMSAACNNRQDMVMLLLTNGALFS